MSRLTITEKEHWKTRIERRIDKAIESVESKHHEYLAKLRENAKSLALDKLGIGGLNAKLERFESQKRLVDEELEAIETKIAEHLLGQSECKRLGNYHASNNKERRIRRMTEQLESELLSSSDIGKEILRLRAEKESLLDTVWLATSNKQICDLWCRVGDVLGDGLTPVQQQLLTVADTETKETLA